MCLISVYILYRYHRNKEGFQDLCVALVTSGAPLKRVAPRYFLKGKLNVQLFYELMKNVSFKNNTHVSMSFFVFFE